MVAGDLQQRAELKELDFANRVQKWALRRAERSVKLGGEPDVTVGEAADHFKCDPREIIRAVRRHYWMYVALPTSNWALAESGDTDPDAPITFDDPRRMIIGHEGE